MNGVFAFARQFPHSVAGRTDGVYVVAGAAHQGVVTVLAEEKVVASVSEQHVVSGASPNVVPAGAAGDHIVQRVSVGPSEKTATREREVFDIRGECVVVARRLYPV